MSPPVSLVLRTQHIQHIVLGLIGVCMHYQRAVV
uniref:Uncharacterized protein n=1 Tax=Anguilla anguilla TaxID=7936 RepID=A0A0E9T058_ANGAN